MISGLGEHGSVHYWWDNYINSRPISTRTRSKTKPTKTEVEKPQTVNSMRNKTKPNRSYQKTLEKKYPWFFKLAWLPVLRDTKGKTSCLENIGIHPVFVKQKDLDFWPRLSNGVPAIYLMQFFHPEDVEQKTLIQIFVPPLQYVDEEKAIIRRIPKSQLTDRIKMTQPRGLRKFEEKPTDKNGCIIKWEKIMDPAVQSQEKHEKLEKVATQKEISFLKNLPSEETLKIGGWGNTMQWEPFEGFINNIYISQYVDAGTLHIMEDGTLEGDFG